MNLQNGFNMTIDLSSQNELKELLHKGLVTVKFTKKDGTERVMRCTLNSQYLPEQIDLEESIQKKKPNPDVLAVYDIENDGWRSFRLDSVISYK